MPENPDTDPVDAELDAGREVSLRRSPQEFTRCHYCGATWHGLPVGNCPGSHRRTETR